MIDQEWNKSGSPSRISEGVVDDKQTDKPLSRRHLKFNGYFISLFKLPVFRGT